MSVCENRYLKNQFEKIASFVDVDPSQLDILWQMNQLSISLVHNIHQQSPEFDADAVVQPSHIQHSECYQTFQASERIICQYIRTLDTKVFALLYASLLMIDDEDATFQKVIKLMHTVMEEIRNNQLERLYNIFMVYYPVQRDKGLKRLII